MRGRARGEGGERGVGGGKQLPRAAASAGQTEHSTRERIGLGLAAVTDQFNRNAVHWWNQNVNSRYTPAVSGDGQPRLVKMERGTRWLILG